MASFLPFALWLPSGLVGLGCGLNHLRIGFPTMYFRRIEELLEQHAEEQCRQ